MKHLYYMIKNANPPNDEQSTFFEGGSGEGGPGTEGGDENPNTPKSKAVEDSSTKGEKKRGEPEKDKRGSGGDTVNGKQAVTSDEDFYYQGDQDEFDAFVNKEELLGVNEYEPKASFDDWEEETPLDSKFDEKLKK